MISSEKLNSIYQMSLEDSTKFNNFLEHPENFKGDFELTSEEIEIIQTVLNETVTIKDVLSSMNKPIPVPGPRPWHLYFNDKFTMQ